MKVRSVMVNHFESNYFDDYDELRSDTMVGVTEEKILAAIDRMVRRHRRRNIDDCIFAENEDGTGWRLSYEYDHDKANGGDYTKNLTLRHYSDYSHGNWNVEATVTVSEAKEKILG